MKNENAIKKNAIRSSFAVAGLALVSASAQASVEFTTYGSWFTQAVLPVYAGDSIFYPTSILTLNTPSASANVNGSLYYSVGSNTGNFNENDSSTDGSTVGIELNRKGYAYRAEAAANAGVLKAVAETKFNSSNSNGYGYNYGNSSASANANWSDWFVISGGTGLGTANFESVLNGTLSSAKNGSASYSLNIGYSTGSYCYYWYNTCSEADQTQSLFSQNSSLSGKAKSTLSQDIEGEFTFEYDKAFQLTATLNTSAANGGMAEFNLASLGSSLVLPVGAQMLSSSGLYVQAVPEPETYAMLLAGLGLVGFAARRRAA